MRGTETYGGGFRPGETFAILGTYGGIITNSGTQFTFGVTLPRSAANVNISVTKLRANVRLSQGGYATPQAAQGFVAGGYDYLTGASRVTIDKAGNGYTININVVWPSAVSSLNNSVCGVTIDNLTLSFS